MKKFNENIAVSFEFFPARNALMQEKIKQSVHKLETLNPDFFSMTHGALGSSKHVGPAIELGRLTNTPVAAHLAFAHLTKEEVKNIAREFQQSDIRHILALRGDDSNQNPDNSCYGYNHVAEMISDLKSIGIPEISVSAYPEVHPLAESPAADLKVLKGKIEAGANRAITQFFFDNENFLKFRDKAVSFSIDAPIVPGILPILNISTICSFASKCGAHVPDSIVDRFNDITDKDDQNLLAIDIAVQQCRNLIEEGVDRFHFYTLNNADICLEICNQAGIYHSVSNSCHTAES